MILETQRLLLRPFMLDDVDALEAVLGDPVAMQHCIYAKYRREP